MHNIILGRKYRAQYKNDVGYIDAIIIVNREAHAYKTMTDYEVTILDYKSDRWQKQIGITETWSLNNAKLTLIDDNDMYDELEAILRK